MHLSLRRALGEAVHLSMSSLHADPATVLKDAVRRAQMQNSLQHISGCGRMTLQSA